MGVLPDRQNCGLHMRRECRGFPHNRGLTIPSCITARLTHHVPWCMAGSRTSGFIWSRWRGKRSRHSKRMRNPQFYVSGKRPMETMSALLARCEGSPSVTGGFPSQRPVRRSLMYIVHVLFLLGQMSGGTIELPVIWDAVTLMWLHCNEITTAPRIVTDKTSISHLINID